MSNTESIIKHFKKYIPIEADEEKKILNFFQHKSFAKKEHLKALNTVSKQHFFVIKGCLRLYFLNEKGNEQTIQFALENWWLTDYLSFGQEQPSAFGIQAIETTEVLCIDCSNQMLLFQQFPKLESYFRQIYQVAYGASQRRIKYLYDFSREEVYEHFKTNFPDFANRIPQQYLASYLHMTPEYLSEIKKKRRS